MNQIVKERAIDYMRGYLRDSTNIVVIMGVELLLESGGRNLDSNEETYRIEQEYGFSPEEMLTGSFFAAKKERFYDFFKKEMLGMHLHSMPAYDALWKLQEQGKLKAVINQNYHDIPGPHKFRNVIQLNGSVNRYICPRCHKEFNATYILNSRDSVPQCSSCKMALRPWVRLQGERADSRMLAAAVSVCETADVILHLGKKIYHEQLKYNLKLDKPQVKIYFTSMKQLPEDTNDFIIQDKIEEVLPLLVR